MILRNIKMKKVKLMELINDYSVLDKLDDKSDLVTLWTKMYQYAKPYMFRAVLGLIFAIPVGMMDAVMAWSLRPYMNGVLVEKNMHIAVWLPFAIIGISLFQGVFDYLNSYLNAWASTKMKLDVIRDMYKKLLNMECAFFDQKSSGLILTRFSGDAQNATSGFLGQIKLLVTKFCSVIGLVFVLLYNSWQLAFIAVGVLGLAFLPLSFLRKKLTFLSNKGIQVGGELTTHYNEAVGGNKVVKGYNLENNRVSIFDKSLYETYILSMKNAQIGALMTPFFTFLAALGLAIVFGITNNMIVTGKLSPGAFASFITSLLLLYSPFKSLGNTYSDIKGSLLAMERTFKIIDYKPSIRDSENAIDFNEVPQKIEFKNVYFEYVKETPVLKNLNLEINSGETIAFVGNSGGGKTTIANLLPRFYDIQKGNITINGTDIRDIKLQSLRDKIAFVFQDNFLFSGTIKENVLLGKEDASEAEMYDALERAYLLDFVKSLKDGVDTVIGERGVMLSGGQKQRLAIARAFIKDAPIVILDEATSALDNKSEEIVQKALDKLMENRTVLVIAHRLTTVQNANKIVVLNFGEIAEMGTHDELVSRENGAYKALYDAQFKTSAVLG